ncbi:MAG TPA: hypothetical protein VMW41_03815 [Candidatus Bathyarchaeia archaeon]|nr:hypothetical protein [Candidatus Bathyarchaeia archaeon]
MVLHSGKELEIQSPVFEQERERLESLTLQELQSEMCRFIAHCLSDQKRREGALRILQDYQERSLFLENPTTHQVTRRINVPLVPTIIPEESERGLGLNTQATNLVRAAILMKMSKDEDLRNFFEAGVDQLTREIMRSQPFFPTKSQHRWRGDTYTDLNSGASYWMENNGGEPQGDIIVSDALRTVEEILGLCLQLSEDQRIKIAPHSDEQIMRIMITRYRLATSRKDYPIVGYLAWRERSSLSGLEANQTAQRYQGRYHQQALAFDPRDIVDIKEISLPQREPYYLVICQSTESDEIIEVSIIRRLHGEAMENLDLWQNFKDDTDQKLCSDGKETIWQRFLKLATQQVVNPFNSYSTDKKMDVMLGNQDYLDRFGVWETVSRILAHDQLSHDLSLSRAVKDMGVEGIKNILERCIPQANMLRRQNDGLYPGDESYRSLCLNDTEIDTIENNRQAWVLKRDSLAGHSGTSVHVGRSINLDELDYEDYIAMENDDLTTITGMSRAEFTDAWHNGVFRQDLITGRALTPGESGKSPAEIAQLVIRQGIAERSARIETDQLESLYDRVWSILIENSLNRQNCLIQEVIELDNSTTTVMFVEKPDGRHELQTVEVRFDLDPQSIGTVYTYPVIRISPPGSSKTNITGGYGGLGVPISRRMAGKILAYARSQRLY